MLLGAFLVFQVQAFISKCVLAWFGGTPAVWTTCTCSKSTPAVISITNTHSSLLCDSRANISTHVGDGRLVLERMNREEFAVLVLDAFSSDAIPAHVLTREPLQLYSKRLSHNSVLAVHLSNNHLDLVALVHRISDDAGFSRPVIVSRGDQDLWNARRHLGTDHAN